jgi:hypothetical protein
VLSEVDAAAFAKRLAGATDRVADDYTEGDVVHEEPFTDQLCGRLKETLYDFETPNVLWQADATTETKGRARLRVRSLTKTKEEPRYGADLVMVLDIELADYRVRKGLLAQAKRLEPNSRMDADEWRRLREQCDRMLQLTPASAVFLYHSGGVTPISAAAVLAYQERDLFSISTWSIEVLYADFAMCWIGDPQIQATDPQSLEALRLLVDARAAVRLIGRGRDKAYYAPASRSPQTRGRRLTL